MRAVRKYGKRDQSHAGHSQPSPMGEGSRRRAIGKKAHPHRMRKSELGGSGGVDQSLDDSVEQSGYQSED
jgi:hypothetical protein